MKCRINEKLCKVYILVLIFAGFLIDSNFSISSINSNKNSKLNRNKIINALKPTSFLSSKEEMDPNEYDDLNMFVDLDEMKEFETPKSEINNKITVKEAINKDVQQKVKINNEVDRDIKGKTKPIENNVDNKIQEKKEETKKVEPKEKIEKKKKLEEKPVGDTKIQNKIEPKKNDNVAVENKAKITMDKVNDQKLETKNKSQITKENVNIKEIVNNSIKKTDDLPSNNNNNLNATINATINAKPQNKNMYAYNMRFKARTVEESPEKKKIVKESPKKEETKSNNNVSKEIKKPIDTNEQLKTTKSKSNDENKASGGWLSLLEKHSSEIKSNKNIMEDRKYSNYKKIEPESAPVAPTGVENMKLFSQLDPDFVQNLIKMQNDPKIKVLMNSGNLTEENTLSATDMNNENTNIKLTTETKNLKERINKNLIKNYYKPEALDISKITYLNNIISNVK
jgi:hypothetical protein